MNEIQHLIAIQTKLERIERLIKNKKEDDQYMTIYEASQYTRFSVSTLRRKIESGDLVCVKKGSRGGKVILKKSDITTWLNK